MTTPDPRTEAVARVLADGWNPDEGHRYEAEDVLAAADAAAPARTLPDRDTIAKRLYAHKVSDHAATTAPAIWDLCVSAADVVLALLADQPTVAETRAEGWDEGYHAGYVARHVHRTDAHGDVVGDHTPNPYRAARERGDR